MQDYCVLGLLGVTLAKGKLCTNFCMELNVYFFCVLDCGVWIWDASYMHGRNIHFLFYFRCNFWNELCLMQIGYKFETTLTFFYRISALHSKVKNQSKQWAVISCTAWPGENSGHPWSLQFSYCVAMVIWWMSPWQQGDEVFLLIRLYCVLQVHSCSIFWR